MYLRVAVPGDEDAVAAVHVLSWQHAYRGLMPDDYLDHLDPAARAARYTFGRGEPGRPYTTVAVDGGGICGFATTGPCRDADKADAGELFAIYVHPDWWSRGVGRTLIGAARQHLVGQEYLEAVLWVLVGNGRAERFYLTDGWEPDGRRRLQEVQGIRVDEVRYIRSLVDQVV